MGPVSRTKYGHSGVPVSVINALVPDSNSPFLGWKYGHRIVKTSSGVYPQLSKYWLVADRRPSSGVASLEGDFVPVVLVAVLSFRGYLLYKLLARQTATTTKQRYSK
jgi:hypothetical protein